MPGQLIWACINPDGARDQWIPVKVGVDGKLIVEIAEAAMDSGVATAGTNATLTDTTKNWEVNMWEDFVLEVLIGGIEYHRTIISNTADTLTLNALPALVVVAAGDAYEIRSSGISGAGVVSIDNYADATGLNILPANVRSTAVGSFKLRKVQIHWAAVTSNPVTIALDAAAGPEYDTVLRVVTLGNIADMVQYFPGGSMFEPGDVITVAWTNDIGAVQWAVEIGWQE